MNNLGKILAAGGLIAVTIISISYSVFGGFTLFGITFSEIHEASRPLTEKEKRDNADIATKEKKEGMDKEAKSKGDDALKEGQYLNAIHFYMGISDDSAVVSNKAQLVQMATKEYISYILSEADNELENNNFDQAKNLINEALKEINEDEELLKKQEYILLREELHSLVVKESPENAITFINSHNDIFKSDKTVSQIYSEAKNSYLTNIISDSNKSIENHDYESARSILVTATQLIGEDSKINEQKININKKEIDYNISIFTKKEDWYGLYQYINSLDESSKNDKFNELKNARDKLIDITISTSKDYLKEKNYDLAKSVLSDLVQVIGNDDKITNQYEVIGDTLIKDNIYVMRDNEMWRDIINYLNGLPDKEKYKNDYSNAVAKYKAAILGEAQNYIQDEDFYSAYNILIPAYDILHDDSEYLELYEQCESNI